MALSTCRTCGYQSVTIPERLQVALHLLGFEPEVDGMRCLKRTGNDSKSYRFSMQPVSESCARWWTMSSPCSALLSSARRLYTYGLGLRTAVHKSDWIKFNLFLILSSVLDITLKPQTDCGGEPRCQRGPGADPLVGPSPARLERAVASWCSSGSSGNWSKACCIASATCSQGFGGRHEVRL